MKIAFVANGHLTRTMRAVAERLEQSGEWTVYWLTWSRRWARWLESSGIDRSRIGWSNPRDAVALTIDTTENEPTIAELLRSDRVLTHRQASTARRQVEDAVSALMAFVRRNDVTAVFGESTWAAEVALGYALRTIDVPYVSPVAVRYPLGRIGFTYGPLQSRVVELPEPADESVELIASETMARLADGAEGNPWRHMERPKNSVLRRPRQLFEEIWAAAFDTRGNPTQATLGEVLRKHSNPLRFALSARRLRKFMANEAVSDPDDVQERFVLMPLHVQPEASIDVLAWFARDQSATIRAVARELEGSHLVGIKEHSHQFGCRSVDFFRELLKIPNVFLVDPFVDSRRWASRAEAVIQATGTMCLENGLRGRRSVTFANMFFNRLDSVRRMDPQELSGLREFLGDDTQCTDGCDPITYLEYIAKNTRPGIFSCPRSNPSVLSEQNVRSLADAFRVFLHARSSTGPGLLAARD